FGDGNNSFIEQTTFSTELNPRWIATADFKNDQHSDLTITNYNSNSMRVSIAAGSGSFEAYETLNTSSGPNSIAIGDFNSDNNVGLFFGNLSGTFDPQVTFTIGSSSDSVAITDTNRDGHLDFAVINRGNNLLQVFLGYGNKSFSSPSSFEMGLNPFSIA
ncbi:unnamed protein product, partial [Rotaria magnacalcarata]